MALPLGYTLRNVFVRRAAAVLTALGIALTVAVFAGVLSLNEGFLQVYQERGRRDLAIYLRTGANAEGESGLSRETVDVLIKGRPEILRTADGRPMAAAETYLAVYMNKVGGGVTNVPLRGIQPMSLELHGQALELVEGRWPQFGTDEVVVGKPLTTRMENCKVGDTLQLNVTPFQVVGVYRVPGAQSGEVWGDVDRMMDALERPVFQRVVARVDPTIEWESVAKELKENARTPVQFRSERDYLGAQTGALGGALQGLAMALTVIMGMAAILGSVNTMLAAVGARTHEIGVLLAIGFPRRSVFLSFVLESALLGLAGGLIGVLLVLPFHGAQTGAVNWNTFTEVSFAFRVSPPLVLRAFGLAFVLGILGGALPALRAAMMAPVEAIRQQ